MHFQNTSVMDQAEKNTYANMSCKTKDEQFGFLNENIQTK